MSEMETQQQGVEEITPQRKELLNKFIDQVEDELDRAKDVYEESLVDLFEKIKTEKPKTIFFLDRSARPVSWMLNGMMDEMKQTDPQLEIPEIRFISVAKKINPTDTAFDEAAQKYDFDRDSPVLVVDEFSESIEGKRTLDRASDVIQSKLGAKKVVEYPFMRWTKVGGPPVFYKNLSNEGKRILYGIEDTNKESVISNSSVTYGALDVKKRYREVFRNFGKQTAKKLENTGN